MAVVPHFGLIRDPFATTVDPADAFASQAFVAARDAVLHELAKGARLIALIGAAGTGKTLLLQAIEAALARAGIDVCRVSRGDLVIDEARAGNVLLVDEADRMSDAAIIALAKSVADPAQPAAVVALTRRRLDHLALAVAPRTVTLEELGSNDARDFIIDRVRRAGGDPALFTPGALGALTYAAGGSPRLLRLLASGAMFQAAHDGASRVEIGHARRAIGMQRGVAEPMPEPVAPALSAAPAPTPAPLVVSPRAERTQPDLVPATEAAPPPQPAPPTVDPIDEPPPVLDHPWSASPADAEVPARTSRRPLLAGAAVMLLAAAAGGVYLWQTAERAPAPASEPPAIVAEPVARPTRPPAQATVPTPAPAPAPPPAVAPAPELEPEPVAAAAAPVEAMPEPAPATEPPAPKAPPRIVVRYARGQPGAAEAAGRIADLLSARGYDVADIRAAPGRIREASTRYAAGERAAGEAINAAFETVLRAYQPGAVSRAAPNPEGDEARGTIEVWVPDSAAGASRPLRTDAPPS
jgi:type II secretory pathway predicted ATPase ExeA